MNADQPFRIALLVAALVMLPVAAYHRLQARTGEKLDRRQEGLFILLTLRPIGIPLMGGLFAFLINPASMAWSSAPMPEWLRWIGVGLCACAVALLFWTVAHPRPAEREGMEGVVGTSGYYSTEGGHDPVRRPGSTRDELKFRGALTPPTEARSR